MNDTAWHLIDVGIGVIMGIGGLGFKIVANKAHELAEAVLVQNKEINRLNVEVARLEERAKK